MKDLGNGIAWAGFWIAIGLVGFGESKSEVTIKLDDKSEDVVEDFVESLTTSEENLKELPPSVSDT